MTKRVPTIGNPPSKSNRKVTSEKLKAASKRYLGLLQAPKQRGLKANVTRKPNKPKMSVTRTFRFDLLGAIAPIPIAHHYHLPNSPTRVTHQKRTQPLEQFGQYLAFVVN